MRAGFMEYWFETASILNWSKFYYLWWDAEYKSAFLGYQVRNYNSILTENCRTQKHCSEFRNNQQNKINGWNATGWSVGISDTEWHDQQIDLSEIKTDRRRDNLMNTYLLIRFNASCLAQTSISTNYFEN